MKVQKSVGEFIDIAMDKQRAGDVDSALEIYLALKERGVESSGVDNLIALCFNEKRDFDRAFTYAQSACLAVDSKDPYFLNTLGLIQKNQKKLKSAEETFKSVIELDPKNAQYLNNFGNVFYESDQFEACIDVYKRALSIDPRLREAWDNIYRANFRLDKHDEALKCLRNIEVHFGRDLDLVRREFDVQLKLEKFDKAHSLLDEYSRLDPSNDKRHAMKMAVLSSTGKVSDALEYAEQTQFEEFSLSPRVQFCGQLSRCLRGKEMSALDKRLTANIDDLLPMAASQPRDIQQEVYAMFWNQTCFMLSDGKLDKAWQYWFHRMKSDKFITEKRQFTRPRWDGSPLCENQRLLIWREQGVGDEIKYLACLDRLINCPSNVTIECDERVVGIFQDAFPTYKVRKALFDEESLLTEYEDFDYHIPMGDLPALVKLGTRSMVSGVSFLNPLRVPTPSFPEIKELAGGRKILGLSWRSQLMNKQRNPHYTTLEFWTDLILRDDLLVVNLQYGDISSDLVDLAGGVIDRMYFPDVDLKDDFRSTLGLINCCDIVLSPGTATGYLAGAAKKPTLLYGLKATAHLGTVSNERIKLPWYESTAHYVYTEETKLEMLGIIKNDISSFVSGEITTANLLKPKSFDMLV